MNQESKIAFIFKLLIAVMAAVLLIRIFPPFRFILVVGFGAAFIGGMIYLLFQSVNQRRNVRAKAGTLAGRIEQRIDTCNTHVAEYETEIAELREDLRKLRDRIDEIGTPHPESRRESERLAREFEREIQLRQSKIDFFQQCIGQLEDLLRQHYLNLEIQRSREKIDQLKQRRTDDVASMEEMRYQIEQESIQLETITELSQRAAAAEGLDQTEFLRGEIQKMARS